jgi:hydroxymethylglutaryl-CoA synthase
MFGICSYGGYVPRYRLNRGLIYAGIGWMNAGNIALARGEKAVANFDEDSITMAVAAGTDALTGIDRSKVQGVYFASTTMPYKERLNAGIISGALGLDETVRAADFSGALKAGTTALLSALESVETKRVNNLLVTSADCRLGKPASAQEFIFGDAAAAFVVGSEGVIAEFKDSYSVTIDFADHFRGMNAKFDRQ